MDDQFSTTVSKILIYQTGIICISVIMLAALSDGQRAYSSALGGATAVIPNLCFAFFLSRARNKPAKTLINQFYRGEISKWLLTAALFTIALQQSGIDFLSMLGTYIAAVSVFWFALLIR